MTFAEYRQVLRRQLYAWAVTGGIIASMATLLAFLSGGSDWLVGLFAHFRVHYAIGLLAITLIMVLLKRWRTACVFLIFALINLSQIAPLLWGGVPATSDGPTLRAMMFNVKTDEGSPALTALAIESAEPDILVLEEISQGWLDELAPVLQRFPYREVRPRGDNFGIGVFSKIPLTEGEAHYLGRNEVPTITVTLATPDGPLLVIATHPVPPMSPDLAASRNAQLAELPELVGEEPTLLLGDLNATPWDGHFQRLLRESGLRDSERGFGWQPTWPVQIWWLRIPLDHCLHSPSIGIVNRTVLPAAGSDHFPIVIDFKMPSQ